MPPRCLPSYREGWPSGSRWPAPWRSTPNCWCSTKPTAGLDPDRSRGFVKLVKTLSHEYALTVFMVTHDLDTLSTLATRIAVLAEGRMVADGPLAEVEHSNHPFVASFFGKTEPLLHSD